MVIHNGPKAADTVGVIIEAKKPGNKSEMISPARPNAKALHELISYYLHERYLNDNKEVKHLIVTNTWEWYIFDAADFENFFFDNKKLVKNYKDWNDGMLVGDTTDWFYEEVAKPFIDKELAELHATYFNLKDAKDIISSSDKEDDILLVNLYKVLSGEHLLKKPFANDSNRLNKEFYNELLHILGLEEIKEGSKKLIDRKTGEKRDEGSLLENTINSLTVRNKLIAFPNPGQFGETNEQQIYSLALELCINWLNRILFLKLLEGQLKQYHKGDTSFNFLNAKRINDYDELDELFFEVLALETNKRSSSVNSKFGNIPYLNSSLFEISDLESKTIQIGSLKGRLEIPLYSNTVLKDNNEKKLSGKKNTLHYLFEFLGAYNFASDSAELIQEENKSIINASVLGLIFEKINGYKDGSFFTPGFITMYMCRETIRRAVMQKFREADGREFEKIRTYEELKDKIDHTDKTDRRKANEIINSIKICDPAVGSGHFLVSALNELIAIKADLGVLTHRNGNRVKEYKITVANDELIILDKETSKPFAYVLNQQQQPVDELQDLQETLFHEKQTIIENCLFGVDINPKSVTICRLRLWIELLKNAYYTKESKYRELETLPNIDINIKCGNSLINQFRLDEDLKAATPYFVKKILEYKSWVADYKNENDKEKKRGIRQLINDLKKGFLSKITDRNPVKIKLTKLTEEFLNKYVNEKLFSQDLTTSQKKDKERLDKEIKKLDEELDAYIKNPIYDNAFEWRFEFPEVLDNNGNYVGFDVVIGNPPYFSLSKDEGNVFYETHFNTFNRTGDIYCLFYELGNKILRPNQLLTFITSNKWMRASYGRGLREFFINETNPYFLFDFSWYQVFENASVDTNILSFRKSTFENNLNGCLAGKDFNLEQLSHYVTNNSFPITSLESSYWSIVSLDAQKIKTKIENIGKKIEDWNLKVNYGIKSGYNVAFQINTETREKLIKKDKKNEEIIVPFLRGRDIERFGYNFANLYLINSYNGFLVTIKECQKNIKKDTKGGFLYRDKGSKSWKNAKE